MKTVFDTLTMSNLKEDLDFDFINHYLKSSYWGKDLNNDIIKKSITHSLTFGLYLSKKQIGFARFVTDYCRFAYMADVFISKEYQRLGIGKWFMERILESPELKEIPKIMLTTSTASNFYKLFQFQPVNDKDGIMLKRLQNGVFDGK